MMISRTQLQNVLAAYQAQQTNPGGKKERVAHKPGAEADQVALSPTAREYQLARKALKEAPVIREEKVAALSERLQAGTYHVTGEEVAEKMISRAIVDELV